MEAFKKVEKTMAVDLGALLDAGDGAVVTVVAGDTRLVAHRAVLAERSPVFRAMFQHDTLEVSSGQIAIPDVEGPVLRQLLAYLYTLQAPQLPGMAPQLLAAADKYGVSLLKAECERQAAAQLEVENAAATAALAVRHSCSTLKKAALTFIKARPFEVMATQGWADAMRHQPEDLIEVSRLLYDPPTETTMPPAGGPHQPPGDHSRTPPPAAPPTHGRQSPPPEAAAVSRLRSLPTEEIGRRLIRAAQQRAVRQVRALLAAGADVGARDGSSWTALHYAAGMGHEEVAGCLVRAGAEVDARTGDHSTPLHIAASNGHAAVARLLLAASASPHASDSRGRTPLHCAAVNGQAGAAAALLGAGADRGATDHDGKTPLDLARQSSRHQLTHMLS